MAEEWKQSRQRSGAIGGSVHRPDRCGLEATMTSRIIGLALVLAALPPLSATAFGQKPRDHRVEVTSAKPRKLTTVHVRPRPASLGAGTIDWLDRTQAPPELDMPRTGSATVLADAITLADE